MPEGLNDPGRGIFWLHLSNFNHTRYIVLNSNRRLGFLVFQGLQCTKHRKAIPGPKSSLSRGSDIDQVTLTDHDLVFLDSEDGARGGIKLLSHETYGVNGRIEVVRRLFFLGNLRRRFKAGTCLGNHLHRLAAENTNPVSRTNPVGIRDFLVFLPEIRPDPGGVKKVFG